jgi:hypothetical protein
MDDVGASLPQRTTRAVENLFSSSDSKLNCLSRGTGSLFWQLSLTRWATGVNEPNK